MLSKTGAAGRRNRLKLGREAMADARHPAGTYRTPGAAAELLGDARLTPWPRLGADAALACVLGLSRREIGGRHDSRLVA